MRFLLTPIPLMWAFCAITNVALGQIGTPFHELDDAGNVDGWSAITVLTGHAIPAGEAVHTVSYYAADSRSSQIEDELYTMVPLIIEHDGEDLFEIHEIGPSFIPQHTGLQSFEWGSGTIPNNGLLYLPATLSWQSGIDFGGGHVSYAASGGAGVMQFDVESSNFGPNDLGDIQVGEDLISLATQTHSSGPGGRQYQLNFNLSEPPDNVCGLGQCQLWQDFSADFRENPPEVVGGTNFSVSRWGTSPGPVIVAENENDLDNSAVRPADLQLTNQNAGQHNFVTFDKFENSTGRFTSTIGFKISDDDNASAEGMGIVFAPASLYGETGELMAGQPWNVAEEPNLAGSLGIGIDTTVISRAVPNHLSLHWDGNQVGENSVVNFSDIDLSANAEHQIVIDAANVPDGLFVKVTLIDGTDESQHVLFDNVQIVDASLDGDLRLAVGARTDSQTSGHSMTFGAVRTSTGPVCSSVGLSGSDVWDEELLDMLTMEIMSDDETKDIILFDENLDAQVSRDDRNEFVKNQMQTWYGDATFFDDITEFCEGTRDEEHTRSFDTGDLVKVLGAGKYNTEQPARWSEGDWNGDKLFDSTDLVLALSDGGFEAGSCLESSRCLPLQISEVPEPNRLLCWYVIGMLVHDRVRRRVARQHI